jgi:hypothetical protein
MFSSIPIPHNPAGVSLASLASAEGAAEVDVEAIKRSMIEGVSLVATNLAVDLPVANLIHALCMPTPAPECIFRPSTNLLVRKENIRATQLEQSWLGWKDSNLRMAGKKARWVRIINKLLKLLTADSPALPSITHGCHQSCHQ